MGKPCLYLYGAGQLGAGRGVLPTCRGGRPRQQAECDALGISIPDQKIYAVDVAFHEAGLNYGDREITVCKIITKCLRTALCLYGYLGSKDAEIIFATPKIHNKALNDLLPCIEDLQRIVNEYSLDFRFRIIVNNDFFNLNSP